MIFPIYYMSATIFQNEFVKPFGIGKCPMLCDEMLCDKKGENISKKYVHYAELTAHYWVWKNIVSDHRESLIGFCHYRRFLGFGLKLSIQGIVDVSCEEFLKYFKKYYTIENVLKAMKDVDIILPYKEAFNKKSIYQQYISCHHPIEDLEETIKIIHERYSEYEPYIQKVWKKQKAGYFRLSFLMKSELFSDWCSFCFGILFELEQRRDWSNYTEYNNQRIAGFIAERLFNLWIAYQVEHKNIRVKEVPMFFLIDAKIEQDESDYLVPKLDEQSKIFEFSNRLEYYFVCLKYLFSLGKQKQFFKRKKKMMKELRWKVKIKASLKNDE